MIHPARPWTLILSLLITSFHALHPMDNDDPPKKTPLSEHLENFKKKKTQKTVPERPAEELAVPEEDLALERHLTLFRQGKTRKLPPCTEPPALLEVTPLSAHTSEFFRPTARRRHCVQLEAPPKEKTEEEKNLEKDRKKLEKFALRSAVVDNDIPKLKALLMEGAEPHAAHNRTKETTLHAAASLGHDQVLATLLDHTEINIECIDQDRFPAIVHAVMGDHPHCIGHLLERRAWVGPDEHNYTCMHTAIDRNNLFSLLAFLVYCVDPITPIPDPPPPLNVNNDNNNNDNPVAEVAQEADPIEELDTLIESLRSNPVPSLQALCLQKLLKTHLLANRTNKALRCDILNQIWNGSLTYKLPEPIGLALAPLMSFATARTFIASFSPNDHDIIAKVLAGHFAKMHLTNIKRLLCTATDQKETPLQMARALNRPIYMQSLVDPTQCIQHLNIMLKSIAPLAPFLAENPQEQDPFDLFYRLFIYHLKGGRIIFNKDCFKK